MAQEEKDGEAAAEAPKPKSKKKLIIIIAAVVVLAVLGAVAALMLGGSKPPPKGSAEEKEEDVERHYATTDLGTFIVNLSEQSSFLKVKILVEFDPEILLATAGGGAGGGHGGGGAGGGEEVGGLPGPMKDREPMIRDAIIRTISSKSVKELLTVDGKEQLKEELIEAINEAIALDEGPVVAIYFVEFILQ